MAIIQIEFVALVNYKLTCALPGMSVIDLRHELSQRVSNTLQGEDTNIETSTLFDGIDAMEIIGS